MPRYKLRVPEEGAILHGDGFAAVAATKDAAREYLEDYVGEPVPYLHSYIGSCRVVYARDYENGDCHDGAEPGDTTIDYRTDNGRDLRPHECRVWEVGAPRLALWKMELLPPLPIAPETIPVGAPVRHHRLGSGECAGSAFRACGQWFLPCAFDGRAIACEIRARGFGVYYSAAYGSDWAPPPPRYRLTINGEHVADGSEHRLHDLVDIREARLRAEWEAEQDREREAAIA